jgi:hypothetical protein
MISSRLREFGRLDPVDQDDHERDVILARTQLDKEAFVAAWAAGPAMCVRSAREKTLPSANK